MEPYTTAKISLLGLRSHMRANQVRKSSNELSNVEDGLVEVRSAECERRMDRGTTSRADLPMTSVAVYPSRVMAAAATAGTCDSG